MAALVAAIHASCAATVKAWMRGTSPRMTAGGHAPPRSAAAAPIVPTTIDMSVSATRMRNGA